MNEQEILKAIAVLERGVELGYREYASDVSRGLPSRASNTLRAVKKAEKELSRLRRMLPVTTSGKTRPARTGWGRWFGK